MFFDEKRMLHNTFRIEVVHAESDLSFLNLYHHEEMTYFQILYVF